MKPIKMVCALVSAVFLVSCNSDLDGQLNVTQKVNFKTDTGGFSLAPGSYAANVSRKDKETARLTIALADGKKAKAFFKIPKGALGENQFTIPAAQNGQDYDLQGARKTVEDRGPLRRNQETCSYTVYERVCHIDSKGNTVCQVVPVQRNGWKSIEYYDVSVVDELWLTLVKANQKPASFYGKEKGSYRDVVSEGRCY